MAEEGIAFVKFPEMAATLRRTGVNIGESYLNDKLASELTVTFSQLIARDFNDMLKHAG
jgi:hypothetical protein